MLSSSEVKWRCLWHMLVWSILMAVVSQFFDVLRVVAFFFLAAFTVIVLPIITSVYSNTSGQRGSSLIRVGYVFCDPVLASITIVPTLILNQLPQVLTDYHCLKNHGTRNASLGCLLNYTEPGRLERYTRGRAWGREQLMSDVEQEFLLIEMAMVMPILLVLVMGRRTHKMCVNTQLLIFAYWFVASLDAIELLETAMLSKRYKHIIFTTEAIVFISMILSNSYAVVTLCSYLAPKDDEVIVEKHQQRFDFVYKAIVCTVAIFFCEVPMLVARIQILRSGVNRILVGTFILWIIKNVFFVFFIFLYVFFTKVRKVFRNMQCKPLLDSDRAFFKPEKRDAYIYSHQFTHARRSSLKKQTETGQTLLNKEQKRVTFFMDGARSKVRQGPSLCPLQEASEVSAPVASRL